MRALASEEHDQLSATMATLNSSSLLRRLQMFSAILELKAGAGGDEAALFAVGARFHQLKVVALLDF